jgi:hypothetical protein
LGVNRTYDEALKIIAADKASRLTEVATMKKSLEELMKGRKWCSGFRWRYLKALNCL